MSIHQAKNIAKQYATVLKDNDFDFVNAYLFGSHVSGKAKEYSDIDVAIIVDHIKSDKEYMDKKMQLWEFTTEIDAVVEPFLIEKEDFKMNGTMMGSEVKKHGILVA